MNCVEGEMGAESYIVWNYSEVPYIYWLTGQSVSKYLALSPEEAKNW